MAPCGGLMGFLLLRPSQTINLTSGSWKVGLLCMRIIYVHSDKKQREYTIWIRLQKKTDRSLAMVYLFDILNVISDLLFIPKDFACVKFREFRFREW